MRPFAMALGAPGETSWRYAGYIQNTTAAQTIPGHIVCRLPFHKRLAVSANRRSPPVAISFFRKRHWESKADDARGANQQPVGGTCGEHHPYQVRIIA